MGVNLNISSILQTTKNKDLKGVRELLVDYLEKTIGLDKERAKSLIDSLNIANIASKDKSGLSPILIDTENEVKSLVDAIKSKLVITETIYDKSSGELKFIVNGGQDCISISVPDQVNKSTSEKLLNLFESIGVNNKEAKAVINNLKEATSKTVSCGKDIKLIINITNIGQSLARNPESKPEIEDVSKETKIVIDGLSLTEATGEKSSKFQVNLDDTISNDTEGIKFNSTSEGAFKYEADWSEAKWNANEPEDPFGVDKYFKDKEETYMDKQWIEPEEKKEKDPIDLYFEARSVLRALTLPRLPLNMIDLEKMINEEQDQMQKQGLKTLRNIIAEYTYKTSSNPTGSLMLFGDNDIWKEMNEEQKQRDLVSNALPEGLRKKYDAAIREGNVSDLASIAYEINEKYLALGDKPKETNIPMEQLEFARNTIAQQIERTENLVQKLAANSNSIDFANSRARSDFFQQVQDSLSGINHLLPPGHNNNHLDSKSKERLEVIKTNLDEFGKKITGGLKNATKEQKEKLEQLQKKSRDIIKRIMSAIEKNDAKTASRLTKEYMELGDQAEEIKKEVSSLSCENKEYQESNSPCFFGEESKENLKEVEINIQETQKGVEIFTKQIEKDIKQVEVMISQLESENSQITEVSSLDSPVTTDWTEEITTAGAQIDKLINQLLSKITEDESRTKIASWKKSFSDYIQQIQNEDNNDKENAIAYLKKQTENLQSRINAIEISTNLA